MTMTVTVYVLVAALALVLVYIYQRRSKVQGGDAEARLQRYYQEQIQNYKPTKPPKGASKTERLVYFLKAKAVELNHHEPFVGTSIHLWRISEEGTRPLLVLVMGEFKTGKSTFINTLLGDDVLATDAAPATAVTTMLKYGAKPEIALHYNDGRTAPYPFDKLGEITAEGDDSKRQLRERLAYVELSYPNEMLKQINLVDTPGLNVHRESHIRNTKNFQEKADVVLWVFNAARSVTQSESREIKALGKHLKPFAIVNRIDNIDEEEESVEELLASVKRRLGKSVQGVFGLSAKQAQKAMRQSDPAKLQESRWPAFLEKLEDHFLKRSVDLKFRAILEKVQAFLQTLEKQLNEMQRLVDAREKKFSSQDEAEKNIRDEIAGLESLQQVVLEVSNRKQESDGKFHSLASKSEDVTTIDQSEYISDVGDSLINVIVPLLRVKEVLEQAISDVSDEEAKNLTAMVDDIGMMDTEVDNQVERFKIWWKDYRSLVNQGKDLDEEKKHVEYLRHDYENSGLFGGEPIFDFSGRRKRMNNAIREYDKNLESFQVDVKLHWMRYISLCRDTAAINKDVEKIAKHAGAYFLQTKVNLTKELEHVQQNFQQELQRQKVLKRELQAGRRVWSELNQRQKGLA